MSLFGPVSTANLERLGIWDLYVGTDGRTADLFAAYTTHTARFIMLGPGATLSADLTISAANVVIWAPYYPRSLNLGNKKLTITGDFCALAGFRIDGAPGVGIEIGSSSRVFMERVAVANCGSHGIYLNGAGNDCIIQGCMALTNAGDGLRVAAGMVRPQVIGGLYSGNTGFGVNDLANTSILNGPRVSGNTAGQVNGTPAQNHAVTS